MRRNRDPRSARKTTRSFYVFQAGKECASQQGSPPTSFCPGPGAAAAQGRRRRDPRIAPPRMILQLQGDVFSKVFSDLFFEFLSSLFSILLTAFIAFVVAGKNSELWRRHRRKVFVSLVVVGGGYALYKLYSAQRDRYLELEVERERQREAEEIIKNQLRSPFFIVRSLLLNSILDVI